MILSRPLAVVTPTLEADVLRVLALADTSFTPGEIHRLTPSTSISGLRRALNRLAEQGIVHAERTPVAVLYSLNRRHLAADPIIALARLPETLLDRLRDQFASWSTPTEFAAVFGSAARGDMRADSDLDLFVVRPSGLDPEDSGWRAQLDTLAAEVTAWTGNDARILEYGEDEVTGRSPVLEAIRAEGLVVSGSLNWLQRRLTRVRVRR